MPRFDEIELEAVPFETGREVSVATEATAAADAPRLKRLAALLIDLSLFAALALALSPLLPPSLNRLSLAALAGFVVVMSYYYYAGTWLLWGKTIGGAIFDVRVISSRAPAMALKSATLRWLGLYLSLATGGLGFLLAALPSRLSLADRMSRTRCVAG
jgi:uncharacterized RDD family membrane protein YckC